MFIYPAYGRAMHRLHSRSPQRAAQRRTIAMTVGAALIIGLGAVHTGNAALAGSQKAADGVTTVPGTAYLPQEPEAADAKHDREVAERATPVPPGSAQAKAIDSFERQMSEDAWAARDAATADFIFGAGRHSSVKPAAALTEPLATSSYLDACEPVPGVQYQGSVTITEIVTQVWANKAGTVR